MRGMHGRHAGSGETATIKDAIRASRRPLAPREGLVRRIREERVPQESAGTPIDSTRSSRVLDASPGSRTDIGRVTSRAALVRSLFGFPSAACGAGSGRRRAAAAARRMGCQRGGPPLDRRRARRLVGALDLDPRRGRAPLVVDGARSRAGSRRRVARRPRSARFADARARTGRPAGELRRGDVGTDRRPCDIRATRRGGARRDRGRPRRGASSRPRPGRDDDSGDLRTADPSVGAAAVQSDIASATASSIDIASPAAMSGSAPAPRRSRTPATGSGRCSTSTIAFASSARVAIAAAGSGEPCGDVARSSRASAISDDDTERSDDRRGQRPWPEDRRAPRGARPTRRRSRPRGTTPR